MKHRHSKIQTAALLQLPWILLAAGALVCTMPDAAHADYFHSVTNASINALGPTARLAPGAAFNALADYQIWSDASCLDCVGQLVLGTDSGSRNCIYDDIPGGEVSGTGAAPLTAPCDAGRHDLKVKFDLNFNCADAIDAWSTNQSSSSIGTVIVPPELQPMCGDRDDNGKISTPDALGILRAAIGIGCCDRCVCDMDGSGAVRAGDALAALRLSVGLVVAKKCPASCSGDIGATVGGFSWFLSDAKQSCRDACAAHGLAYDEATRTYAGSQGSFENCVTVLDALGLPPAEIGAFTCAFGEGCGYNNGPYARYWCAVPDTTAEAVDPAYEDQRACACHNTLCGNAILNAGEECDDGNLINGDGCNVDCTAPSN